MERHWAETRFSEGRNILLVDGVEVPPIFYALTDLQEARCRTELAQRNVNLFSGAGIDLVQCDWNMRDGWTRENTFDPTAFFENIAPMTRPGSKTRLVVRLHLNAPVWWMDEHPDEMTVFGEAQPFAEDLPIRLIAGDDVPSRRVSLASGPWLHDAGKVLADFCRKMDESERGNFVIGIQPACGMFGEWHWWAGGYDPDHSQAQTKYFRNYLRKIYPSVEALQKAWGKPGVTFDTARIPSIERRRGPYLSNFRSPDEYQDVIDCHKAQMLVPAEAIIYFCRLIKETVTRPVLTGAFFTYFFATQKTVSGHIAADPVLKSPYVDYLGAPAVYGDARLPGHSCISRGILESCRLNKKIFLTEMDQPPAGATNAAPGGDPALDGVTINLMRRNVMEPFTRGMGLWYYDHRLMGPDILKNFGWWETPVLISEVAKQNEIYRRYYKRPYRSEAELLCVWGTETFYHTSGNPYYAAPIAMDELTAVEEIARCGVPHDHIYMEDLPLAELDHYKVIVVHYAGMLSAEQRTMLREKLLTSGKEVIFVNNAGYSDGKTLSAENVKDITGIAVSPTLKHSSCSLCGEQVTIKLPYQPLMRPDDPEAENVAFFEDGAEPAGAVKKYGNTSVWYFAFPLIPSKFFRDLSGKKGAHVYCGKDLIVKAGRGILCCHAPADGAYDITLKSGKVVQWNAKEGETLILDAADGTKLID